MTMPAAIATPYGRLLIRSLEWRARFISQYMATSMAPERAVLKSKIGAWLMGNQTAAAL